MTDTRAFYGQWAPIYDRLASLPVVADWRESAAEALELDPGDTVVEMGTGTGANVPALRDRVGAGGHVVGVDLTAEMLARARGHDDRTGDGVHYARGDASQPLVRDVDAVLATFVVGLFADPAAVVDRWCDCVSPGGRVALLNFQRSPALLATPANAAFELFVRLSAPGKRLSTRSHADAFEQRVAAARKRLTERTVERRSETFAGGYLGLVSGRVE